MQDYSWIPSRNMNLGACIDEYFAHEGIPCSRIHVTDLEGLKKIQFCKFWEQCSGASFSFPGMGTLSTKGPVAIRIKPGHEQKIEWKKDPHGTGLIPIYWPSGVVGQGESKANLPIAILQFFNPNIEPYGRWRDF